MPNDLDHVRSLAKQDSFAVVTTARSDGTIHASVVRAGVLDSPKPGDACIGFVVAAAASASFSICAVAAGRRSCSGTVGLGRGRGPCPPGGASGPA